MKLLCRPSYEMTAAVMGTPFDYPLSSRMDENDSILIFDKLFVPYENVFAYGDIDKVNNFFPRSGFLPRFLFQGCTRLAVSGFLSGLLRRRWTTAPRLSRRACAVASPHGQLFWGLPTRWASFFKGRRAVHGRMRPRWMDGEGSSITRSRILSFGLEIVHSRVGGSITIGCAPCQAPAPISSGAPLQTIVRLEARQLPLCSEMGAPYGMRFLSLTPPEK